MSEYTDIISDGGLDPRNALDAPTVKGSLSVAPTTLEPVAEVEHSDVMISEDALYRSTVISAERLSVGAELFVLPPDAAAIIASKEAEIEQHRNNIAEFIRDANKKEETLRTEVERLTEKNQLLNSAFCESVDDVERLTLELDGWKKSSRTFLEFDSTQEQLAAAQRDAERYRFIKPLLFSADFAYPVNDGEEHIQALIFNWQHSISASLDASIDAAMQGKEGE